jgi:RNA recognition motif-containing protein
MRGLPYKVQPAEVIKFFDGFGKVNETNVFIEEFNGKRTGSALVIFENKELAQKAKEDLNKKEIGSDGRYVELYDQYDQFMKKICNLFTD